MSEPHISHVRVRNYKSIAKCDIPLSRTTILVGRNGSGKSNFLDALRFILDGLQTSLDHAVRSRGGIEEVRRRSTGHPHNFTTCVELNLPASDVAEYRFEIGARPKGGFVVKEESLKIRDPRGQTIASYGVREGEVQSSLEHMPAGTADRLYLVTASGRKEFLPVYSALVAMGFYSLNPEQMKDIQSPDAGELLRRDGSNIASVVSRLETDRPEIKARIAEYLTAIVPDIQDFERLAIGHKETLRFKQAVKGSQYPWWFSAASVSDGTLRSLGILVAAMQLVKRQAPIQLVGLEEPESALHPAAAGALMDSLREAACHTQILLTTHSPDVLERVDLEEESLLVVQSRQGETQIAPADSASLKMIREHLYSAGELLRMDQLQPDEESVQRQLQWDS